MGERWLSWKIRQNANTDIALLDTATAGVTPFLNSPSDEKYPEFSARWPLDSLYIQLVRTYGGLRAALPGSDVRYPISSEGGIEPVWASNSKQLFYRWPEKRPNQMWVVDVPSDGGPPSKPRLLFEKSGYDYGDPIRGI